MSQNEFNRAKLLSVLSHLSFGSSVAEFDNLLFDARVETGTFWDLYNDKVDLIPGSKGSGKSSLFQLFVKYLHPQMIDKKRVLLAHGVETQGNQVFQDFANRFSKLTPYEFQNFWYVYFTTLINEILLKNEEYTEYFSDCHEEIADFRAACLIAKIPNVQAPQTLLGMLEWCFTAEQTHTAFRICTDPASILNKRLHRASCAAYVHQIIKDPRQQSSCYRRVAAATSCTPTSGVSILGGLHNNRRCFSATVHPACISLQASRISFGVGSRRGVHLSLMLLAITPPADPSKRQPRANASPLRTEIQRPHRTGFPLV